MTRLIPISEAAKRARCSRVHLAQRFGKDLDAWAYVKDWRCIWIPDELPTELSAASPTSGAGMVLASGREASASTGPADSPSSEPSTTDPDDDYCYESGHGLLSELDDAPGQDAESWTLQSNGDAVDSVRLWRRRQGPLILPIERFSGFVELSPAEAIRIAMRKRGNISVGARPDQGPHEGANGCYVGVMASEFGFGFRGHEVLIADLLVPDAQVAERRVTNARSIAQTERHASNRAEALKAVVAVLMRRLVAEPDSPELNVREALRTRAPLRPEDVIRPIRVFARELFPSGKWPLQERHLRELVTLAMQPLGETKKK